MSLHSLASGADLHEDKRIKRDVRAAAIVPVTISTPGSTMDGVTLSSGDRVLLTAQSTSSENGIYAWNGASSTLSRTGDASGTADFVYGFLVFVREGTSNAGTYWIFTTTSAITLGSTTLSFSRLQATGPTGATGATGPVGAQGPPGVTTITGAPPYAVIQDQKAQNTNGGTFTSGAWQTRTLNTLVNDDSGLVLLSSNQFTLQAGTYRFEISCPAFNVQNNQARLQNITDGTTLLTGTSEWTFATSNGSVVHSHIGGRIALASAKTLAVQHQCSSTFATQGFGVAAGFGTEVYTTVELWLIGSPAIPPGSRSTDMPLVRRRTLAGTDVDMPPSGNTLLPV